MGAPDEPSTRSAGFTDEQVHVYLATDLDDAEAEADENERIEIVAVPLAELDGADRATARTRRRSIGLLLLQNRACSAEASDGRSRGESGSVATVVPGRAMRARSSTWCSTSSPTSSSSAACRATRSRPTAPTCSSSARLLAAHDAERRHRHGGQVSGLPRRAGRRANGKPAASPATIHRKAACLRSFYRHLRREGVRRSDPTAAISAPAARPASCRRSSPRARSHSCSPRPRGTEPAALRDRALLELMYACGLRASEAIGLELRDVDLDDGVLRARGKGSKERIVPVGREARRGGARLPRARPPGARAAARRAAPVRQLPRRRR